jgi:hypothetical protein
MMTNILGPVGKLLSDKNRWTQMRDCGTINNRHTTPDSTLATTWSLRAAAERFYPNEWRAKLTEFMTEANKHYPGKDYKVLHKSLSHEALMALLKRTGL